MTRWRAGEVSKPTVTSVAVAAHLSRSALYRSHRGVVLRIQVFNGEAQDKRQAQLNSKISLLRGQLKAEKSLTRALAYAAAELAAELNELKLQFDDERLRWQLRVSHLEKQALGQQSIRVLRRP
jgi:sirohydrochlorin ferrochelatase